MLSVNWVDAVFIALGLFLLGILAGLVWGAK